MVGGRRRPVTFRLGGCGGRAKERLDLGAGRLQAGVADDQPSAEVKGGKPRCLDAVLLRQPLAQDPSVDIPGDLVHLDAQAGIALGQAVDIGHRQGAAGATLSRENLHPE